VPNNRQWAALVWLLVLGAFALARRDSRHMVTDVVRHFCELKVLVPVFLFAAYCAGLIAAGAALGAWTPERTTDTVVWFGGALALLFRATEVAKERQFIRHSLVEPMRVAALLVFFVGLFPLPLWAELVLLPIGVLAVALTVVASGQKEHAAAKRLGDSVLTAGGLALIGWATYRTLRAWGTVGSADTVRALLLPIWATAAVVPVVYLFSVLMGYEQVALHIGNATSLPSRTMGSFAGVASVLKLRVRELATFDTFWAARVAEAGSFEAARAVASEYRQSLRDEEEAKRRGEGRLRKYAGVQGTDEEGRQIDEREFDVTRTALQWLATVQMGCYHNGSRYKPEALRLADPPRHGLPDDHGIHMVVREDGRAWYAWRRTPSDWCLGIGAAAPPPDQWLGDGSQPPKGFPGLDPWWGFGPFGANAANW
jgi:hypothetical protein